LLRLLLSTGLPISALSVIFSAHAAMRSWRFFRALERRTCPPDAELVHLCVLTMWSVFLACCSGLRPVLRLCCCLVSSPSDRRLCGLLVPVARVWAIRDFFSGSLCLSPSVYFFSVVVEGGSTCARRYGCSWDVLFGPPPRSGATASCRQCDACRPLGHRSLSMGGFLCGQIDGPKPSVELLLNLLQQQLWLDYWRTDPVLQTKAPRHGTPLSLASFF
jgi:hypothetical protein